MPALLRAALAAATLLLGPLPHARAEGLSWVVVTGVAAGDVLNVREAPDGDARVLGALSPGALVVSSGETARSSVEWTRVASGELEGWAASRFLAPARFETLDDHRLPVAGACGGVEPFWGARWADGALTLTAPGEPDRTLPIASIPKAEGRPYGLIQAKGERGAQVLLAYEETQCRDAVIDAPVLGRGALIVIEGDETRWYSGCCRPAPGALAVE